MDCGVGAGVYHESLNISKSFRLPNFASVFQAELLAIKEACKVLRSNLNQTQNVAILTDSQAAIKAISSAMTSSKLVQQCREQLSILSESLTITLVWIPGHSGFEGNEKADELARQGSALHESLAEAVNIPIGVMKGNIFSNYLKKANDRWHSLASCAISRKIWPTYNKSKTNDLISRPRKDISRIVAVCTGHWPIGEHAAKLGIPHNTCCRSCLDQQEKETVFHFLCQCPALARNRALSLGSEFFNDIDNISESRIKDLLSFLNATKWI